VALALALAALLDAALEPDPIRAVLAVLVGGTFLALMVAGYLSTLAYGAVLMAALACLVHGLAGAGPGRGREGRVAAAAVLVGASGLMHLQFLALTAVALAGAGIALLPAWRRDAALGIAFGDRALARVATAGVGGAVVAAAGFLATRSGTGGLPRLDTSRDAFLRRTHVRPSLAESYRRKLHHDFPWYRVATLGALSLTPLLPAARRPRPPLPQAQDRVRFLWGVVVAWLAVTLGSVVLLVFGVLAPAQRLAAFCLPVPILGAVGLARLRANRAGGRSAVGVAGAAAVFLVVAWLAWSNQRPLIAPAALAESRAVGSGLGSQPPGTPLVLVADAPGDKPSLLITRYANYLRDAVPADRVPDVQVFVGTAADFLAGRPTLTGQPEHDRLARDAWARIEPLLGRHPVAVVIQAFDPVGYRAALRLAADTPGPGTYRLVAGVVVLPRFGFRYVPSNTPPWPEGQRTPGTGPMSPWLPVWLAPLLLMLLAAVGAAWAFAVLPEAAAGARWMLAPAVGMAVVGLASVAVDAVGIRLSGAGGPVAVGLGTAPGLLTAWLRRTNRARRPAAGQA
jgi:hypothetical protein